MKLTTNTFWISGAIIFVTVQIFSLVLLGGMFNEDKKIRGILDQVIIENRQLRDSLAGLESGVGAKAPLNDWSEAAGAGAGALDDINRMDLVIAKLQQRLAHLELSQNEIRSEPSAEPEGRVHSAVQQNAEGQFYAAVSTSPDSDLSAIQENIDFLFYSTPIEGVQYDSIQCQSRSCRVSLALSNADAQDRVIEALGVQIGRAHELSLNSDEQGNLDVFFTLADGG
ncbi:hypothetical protein [Teredinibacter turnerae]|uniref:hypothetical protein n=1 Tax=Teredinibacter turnerae TaxID=2426 RepID=UPI00037A7093|nr:hypothetical protein [Teredinibacter turnerae]